MVNGLQGHREKQSSLEVEFHLLRIYLMIDFDISLSPKAENCLLFPSQLLKFCPFRVKSSMMSTNFVSSNSVFSSVVKLCILLEQKFYIDSIELLISCLPDRADKTSFASTLMSNCEQSNFSDGSWSRLNDFCNVVGQLLFCVDGTKWYLRKCWTQSFSDISHGRH